MKHETYLSENLNSIISWLENNFLFLNYSKTKIMLVGSQQKLARVTGFCITVRNRTLGRVYKFEYLGVMLDPCLSWNGHIYIILTLFPLKFHRGWACYAKLAIVGSSLKMLVSRCMTP